MISAGRWQACRRVHGHLYPTRKRVTYRSPVGNELVSQGCPKDGPAVEGPTSFGILPPALLEQPWLQRHPRGVSESFSCQREVTVGRNQPHPPMPFAMARRGILRKPPRVSTRPEDESPRSGRIFGGASGLDQPIGVVFRPPPPTVREKRRPGFLSPAGPRTASSYHARDPPPVRPGLRNSTPAIFARRSPRGCPRSRIAAAGPRRRQASHRSCTRRPPGAPAESCRLDVDHGLVRPATTSRMAGSRP